MAEIVVVAEHRRGDLREVSFEMLSLANRLGSQQDMEVTALLLGHQADALAGRLQGG
ncbi:MAG: electron transfer flavoprotein subunit alpha/FixB family protein, partial [Deltaproteobacteria bacterium]|nr:electron transfer flavoprotein subunit alpha/FixB family protein [Deltaproteobacteria bacterium]